MPFVTGGTCSEFRVSGVGSTSLMMGERGDPGDVKGDSPGERGMRLKSGVADRRLPIVELGNESARLRGASKGYQTSSGSLMI